MQNYNPDMIFPNIIHTLQINYRFLFSCPVLDSEGLKQALK